MVDQYIGLDGRWEPSSPPYKIRAAIVFSVYGLYLIYVLSTFALFLFKSRDKHSGLSQRNVTLVIFQSIGCLLMGTSGMVSTALQKWPCFLRLWMLNVGIIMVISSVAARAMQHIVVTNVHMLTNRLTNRLATSQVTPMKSYLNKEEDREGQLEVETTDMRTYRRLQRYTRLQKYTTNRALTWYVVGHFMVSVALSVVINVVDDQFSMRPMSDSCTLVWGFLPVTGIVGVYVVFVFPYFLIKCWSLKDAYGIRNDLIVSIIAGVVCQIATVLWETVLYDIALKWSGWFFTWVAAIVLHTASLVLPLWAAIRHSKDVILRMHGATGYGPSGDTDISTAIANANGGGGGRQMDKRSEFNAIMADPYEYRLFCDFAASCFCSEMTAFIDEYQVLKGITVAALGSEDMWREDMDQLESSYMARMASNVDGGIGYLAMANRAYPNAKSLRLQTPPTASILETTKAVYPQYDLSDMTPFPAAAMDKLVAIFSVFVNSNSYTAVSLPSAMVLRIRERLSKSQLTLVILDEIKDEVLSMLYFDVFTRYNGKKKK